MPDAVPKPSTHFIQDIVNADNASGKHGGRVHTRFPPEPNGYLHIGHAKSIHLNFGLARQYGGLCNLRFDDTNPAAEDVEYVDAIQEDVRWLGFDWEDRLYFASDYFERLYGYAEHLIEHGHAYVCDLSNEEMSRYRGTVTEPGKPSPYRDRTAAENLELFRAMRAGRFPDGARVLRAKIDMASPNMLMRDPVLYRIKREHHHRTGDGWCIYPLYDYAHPVSDAIENITHSICTLEFEDHRPFYDWVLDRLPDLPHPQQIEFARLNLSHTLMSKRKLLDLVEKRYVAGWDDPRLPTIAGLRRRGYTPEAIKVFAETIGVARRDSTVSAALLEYCLREDLNRRARRVMAVLKPLKVVIENYPEDEVEWFDAENNPEDASAGSRKLPFTRELWIERDDFREEAPKKWFRLSPGREVRLKFAYYVTCTRVIRDPAGGEVTELRCTYDPASRGGSTPDGRKVLGTLHWVSAAHCRSAEVRLYDKLFVDEDPAAALDTKPYEEVLNPESLVVLTGCRVEPALAEVTPEVPLQFLRQGYFCRDRVDGTGDRLVFNRTVTLRDTWAKIEKTA